MRAYHKIGETKETKYYGTMTLIAYRSSTDVDVMFPDGTIVYHRPYRSFRFGNIANPKLKKPRKCNVGDVKTASNGQKMTVTCYRNSADIDVRFEDGYEVKHTTASLFLSGYIKNPNRPYDFPSKRESRLGEEGYNNDGEHMVITAYKDAHDIEVTFDSGTVLEHRIYRNFKAGHIKDPSFRPKKSKKTGETSHTKDGRKITKLGGGKAHGF